MTIKQERTLSMYLAVKKFLLMHNNIVAGLPHFASYSTAFTAAISDIQDAAQLQNDADSKDQTTTKRDLRARQTVLTLQLLAVLKAYFKFKNDTTHQNALQLSRSALNNFADTNYITKCRELYDTAHALPIADLTPYGIDTAWLANFYTKLADFADIIPNPRLTMIDRTVATALVLQHFTTATNNLSSITGLVDLLQFTNAPFYHSFKNVLKVVNVNARALAFKTSVKDPSGTGLRNVNFLFVRQTDNQAFEFTTNENGTIQRRFFNDGIYTLTISKTNYTTISGNVTIDGGDTYILDVEVDTVNKVFTSAQNPRTGEAFTITAPINGQ